MFKRLKSVFYLIKNEGIIKGFLSISRIILGIKGLEEKYCKLQEQVNTLSYFLNEFVDISSIPPTKNRDVRILQQCDAILLAIFDKFCKKHGLTYWLSYGTLLGAVRHKGFIPWDDDMDVAMPREQFNILYPLLKTEFEELGFTISDFDKPGYIIGFGYNHLKTGTWLDVFPVDTYSSSQELNEVRELLKPGIDEYRNIYNQEKDKHDVAYFDLQRRNLLESDGNYKIMYLSIEWSIKYYFYEEDDIYPLTSVRFENYDFPAPNNTEKYLRCLYGDYMSFPTSGIMQHDEGRGPLHTWAKRNGIKMEEVKLALEKILNEYS